MYQAIEPLKVPFGTFCFNSALLEKKVLGGAIQNPVSSIQGKWNLFQRKVLFQAREDLFDFQRTFPTATIHFKRSLVSDYDFCPSVYFLYNTNEKYLKWCIPFNNVKWCVCLSVKGCVVCVNVVVIGFERQGALTLSTSAPQMLACQLADI